ncbi:MAG: hypothetical protein AB2L07_22215 [Thermoanaerobaculaceae bacterium]
MIAPSVLSFWQEVVARLCAGPAPRGETFELARRVLRASPRTAEAEMAVRLLLEGAVADACTGIEDTRAVMAMLKAADSGEARLSDLLPGP